MVTIATRVSQEAETLGGEIIEDAYAGHQQPQRSKMAPPLSEGRYALNWTRLSCHRFVANRVRLSVFVLAYNLGNFPRRLCLTKAVKHWSRRSVQVKLIKMGGL